MLAFGLMPAPFAALGHSIVQAEEAGFDAVWIGDMQSTHRELYVSLAAVTAASRTLRTGPGVTNPLTRDPAVTAGAIATLSELSGGRTFLGIGLGDSAIHNIGLRPGRLADLEAYILAVKSLLRTGHADFGGRTLTLSWWKDAFPVPVYIAAHGPKSLEMAGRIGDGVIAGTGFTPEAIACAKAGIARGAEAAGRAIDDITIWFLSMVNVRDDPAQALGELANPLAALGNILIRNGATGKDIPDDLVPRFEALERRYDFSNHASGALAGANVALIRDLGLFDYLADRFAVAGTGTDCAARIAHLRAIGADNLWFTRTLADSDIFLNKWAQDVKPRLRPAA